MLWVVFLTVFMDTNLLGEAEWRAEKAAIESMAGERYVGASHISDEHYASLYDEDYEDEDWIPGMACTYLFVGSKNCEHGDDEACEHDVVTPEFLEAMRVLRYLRYVYWADKAFLPENADFSFRPWPELEEFQADEISDEKTRDAFCRAIGESESIRKVEMEVRTVEQLATILRAKNLRELDIAGMMPDGGVLPTESVRAIAQLPALEELSIELEDDRQLEELLPLKDTLKYLSITGTGITSDAAKTIRQFTHLRSLSVANTSVDDRFIEEIHHMPLRCLFLLNTDITDACIPYFLDWDSMLEVVFPVVFPEGTPISIPLRSRMTKEGKEILKAVPGKTYWVDALPFIHWYHEAYEVSASEEDDADSL